MTTLHPATAGRLKAIRPLWNRGDTVNEIADELGLTKNQVIGLVHRSDLPPRPSPIKRPEGWTPAPRKPAAVKPAPAKAPLPPRAPAVAKPKPASRADETMIAEFIAQRGVTRCPAAYAAESTACIPAIDRAAHVARGPEKLSTVQRRRVWAGKSFIAEDKLQALRRGADAA